MELVGAALHHHVDGGPALDPELGPRRLLDRELLDGVRRHHGGDQADDAGLAHGDATVVAVVVRDAVDHEVVRRGPRAADVHALESTARPVLDARHDVEQRVEVAAAERHRLDPLRVDAVVELVRELDDG